MEANKIYLAGPEVFHPNALELGRRGKLICSYNLAKGLFPLDNLVDTSLPKQEQARLIVEGNMKMIQQADMVFANLSNFRGTQEHPYCDSGTAWECGYAIGLGKKVIGYTHTAGSIPDEILNGIHLVVKAHPTNNIMDVFNALTHIELRHIHPTCLDEISCSFNMDPPYADIQDSNSSNAFLAGMQCALGNACKVWMEDTRPQIEKYGATDANGYHVEDFGYPINIMIALNSQLMDQN